MNELITIEEFKERWAADFQRLNEEWLNTFFEVEPIDAAMLGNPQAYYIDKGGLIYMAVLNNQQAIGCYALIRTGDNSFELSKMAVDQQFQGNKIGNKLVDHAIQTAKTNGATILELYSHTKLQAALHLYKKFGFKEVPVGNSVYKRSDIKMELQLTEKASIL